MKKSLVSAAALMLLLSACDLNSPRETQNYALVDILATPSGQELSLTPTAVFFRSGRLTLPDSRDMAEACANTPHNPGEGQEIQLELINGGDSVLVSSGLTQAYLYPSIVGATTRYELTGTQTVLAAANTPVTVATIGTTGGFPAMSHSTAALAVPTVGTVVVPVSVSQDMVVTWDQPTNNIANKIEFSIPYTSVDNVGMRLICVFNDDGQATIPASELAGMREALNPPATGEATRFRASFNQVGGDAIIVVVRSPKGFNVEHASVADAAR